MPFAQQNRQIYRHIHALRSSKPPNLSPHSRPSLIKTAKSIATFMPFAQQNRQIYRHIHALRSTKPQNQIYSPTKYIHRKKLNKIRFLGGGV